MRRSSRIIADYLSKPNTERLFPVLGIRNGKEVMPISLRCETIGIDQSLLNKLLKAFLKPVSP